MLQGKSRRAQPIRRVAITSRTCGQNSWPTPFMRPPTSMDRNGFGLGTIVTPGNTHDSHIFEPLVVE